MAQEPTVGEQVLADPSARDKVEAARAFTFHLLKGIKQIGMYRHNEAKFPEFLARALEALHAYMERFGPLPLKVEQQNFLLLGEPLFAEDTPLPYKFYRDGIRQLLFRPGITLEALVAFTLIALSEPDRGADDVLAQLWRAALEHVEYMVVEGFKLDNVSEEEIEVEVDTVVSYLYSRLKTSSEDSLRFARVSSEDLDSKLDGVEQLRGLVVRGTYASDELKAKLQREIAEEEGPRLFPKLVNVVFQLTEDGADDAELLEDVFSQLLDAMLIQDDYATVNQIVLKLQAMAQREGGDGGISRLLSSFIQRMGDEQRLGHLAEMLKHSRPKNPNDVVRYLRALDASSVLALLAALETVEIPENRLLLCNVLATFAKTRPEPFVARLESERPQTVRDMVYILEKSNHPDRMKLFSQILGNKNLALKLEVLSIVSRSRTGEARRLLVEALNDEASQVRMLAAKVLPEFDREKGFADLVRLVRDPGFEKKPPEERAAFYAAIGSTGLPGALAMMSQLLATRPSLLNKKRVLEDKLLAIAGLAGACTIQSYKLLQGVVEDRSQPVEVLTAARKAMHQTKRALFGDSSMQGEV